MSCEQTNSNQRKKKQQNSYLSATQGTRKFFNADFIVSLRKVLLGVTAIIKKKLVLHYKLYKRFQIVREVNKI